MQSTPDLNASIWRKSSYSNSHGGDCIEIAEGFPGVTPIRDSKSNQLRGFVSCGSSAVGCGGWRTGS
ncbi:MAG: DUF397 domain-containing protein [Streptomycetaceae bacterium]|nr:DUF397 domain-containing protein [Streptomycetaceae bacterium]